MRKLLITLSLALAISSQLFCQDFYDISTINTIEITFEESNWDALMDTYYANDDGEKLMGAAVVNGVTFDSVGVKYKGNSTYSASNSKNPLHIYLDYIINQDYEGYESIKLSNGKNDPSFVREVLSYEIARKYTKAPLSNYAKVYINDEYYGLFSSSEAINSDFVENRIYADDDNTRIKCNPEDTNNGNGPSLEYLGTDSTDYYDFYEVKSDYGWQDLIDLTYDIEYNASEIENILDIDHAIWMLAFNNVLVNLDSYIGPFRQNYYLIKDDNNRFVPVIWDLNESLGAFESIDMDNGGGGGRPVASATTSSLDELDLFLREGDDTYPLSKMIFENERYKKMYVAHCKTILEDNFSSGWYSAKADTLQGLISSDLADDPNAFYTSSQFTGNLSSTQDNTIGITELMESRITFLESETEFNYTQPTISNIVQPTDAEPYTTISVTADISDVNYVYLAYRYSKDEAFVKLEMFDDGSHEDGTANDGTYGISFEIDESNTHFYIYAENDDAGIFSPTNAEHEYYKISAEASESFSSDIAINELLASNSTIAMDANDEYDDWIELYNNTDSSISLSGYYLSDDDSDIMQWSFPDTSIQAYSYLIIWADKDEEQDGLHTNFKLSSSGEGVYLVNSDLEIVNSVEYDEQLEDYSFSRNPNGTGDLLIQGATFSYNNEDTDVSNDEIDITSSITSESLNFNVYPIPVSDKLYVTIDTDLNNTSTLSIVNSFGQPVQVTQISDWDQTELDVSALPKGIYILVYETESNLQTRKFIKE